MVRYERPDGRGPGLVGSRRARRPYLLGVGVAMLLVLLACAPLAGWLTQDEEPAGAGRTAQPTPTSISGAVVVEETVPTVAAASTLPVASSEAETLQATLTQLYREVNPSVVFIIVPSDSSSLLEPGGSGSGFVYSGEGHILTNHHVVSAGSSYEIVFAGGERQRAELIGSDLDSDLAVLQVEGLPSGVKPLPLADGASIEVGQFAIAIGNPFGEQGSMSLGIISGLGRSLPSQRMTATGSTYSLPQVIQTDAPINPGNSGGPLLNLNGEVLGVNAAIASATGTNSGVGFSIPVDVVKRIVPRLIEGGEVAYPYMGLTFDGEVSLDELDIYGVAQTDGSYVISVVPGSPADRAGLVGADPETGRGGDLIIAVDGRPIRTFSDLNTFLVLEAEVGQTIELTVLRGEDTLILPLTLGARP